MVHGNLEAYSFSAHNCSWPIDQVVARTEKACEDTSPTGYGNKLTKSLLKIKEKGSRNT